MPDWFAMKPAWRVSQLEMRDPYGWHSLDAATLNYVRTKLSNFESMTIAEIFVKSKKQNHSVSKRLLCNDAQKRLDELRLYDVDKLHSLRLEAKKRVWGILIENVIHLLWWDPEHAVCPSLKD